MNIFVTSNDPFISAKNLDDKRVNKMITESIQMLAYALDRHGSALKPYTKDNNPYKVKGPHKKHPCSIWAGNTRENYLWLLHHTVALCDEFMMRSGKPQSGSTNLPILTAGAEDIPIGPLEPFQNSSMYKDMDNVIDAYKATMIYKWDHDKRMPVWTVNGPPTWYK